MDVRIVCVLETADFHLRQIRIGLTGDGSRQMIHNGTV